MLNVSMQRSEQKGGRTQHFPGIFAPPPTPPGLTASPPSSSVSAQVDQLFHISSHSREECRRILERHRWNLAMASRYVLSRGLRA